MNCVSCNSALESLSFFVTHDQEEALAMSDWIFVMNEGEIVQSGTPVDIYDEQLTILLQPLSVSPTFFRGV